MKAILLPLFAATLLLSCHNRTAKYETLSLPQFQQILSDDAIQILDARTPAEYHLGHIERALNLDIHNTNFDHMTQILDSDKPVAIYCNRCNRSKEAAQRLSRKGYKVYILSNGMEEWRQGGNRVVRK